MHLTASEQATLNFYRWEYRYRGYDICDTPIDIEVPYTSFRHQTFQSSNQQIDDGRVPSLFSLVRDIFIPQKSEIQQQPKIATYPEPKIIPVESVPILVGFELLFPKGIEISSIRNLEFINMLAYSEHTISFEICGSHNSIKVQLVCSMYDKERVMSHIKAYFPSIILKPIDVEYLGFQVEPTIAIADFGISKEFMRPINTNNSFVSDPLTSVFAIMDTLRKDDVAVFQVMFKGITSPLSKDIDYAVSDGQGGSFFSDAPEMPKCAEQKISSPLFSVVMRIATQGENNYRSEYLAQELAKSISIISQSQYNSLIPLSNEGYSYDFHYYNLHHRLSNRIGFILNSQELNTFVHYPNASVITNNLNRIVEKTKSLPDESINQKYILGINTHNNIETKLSLNDQQRLRHTHIIGATGTGKSTLIVNMVLQDIDYNNGCAVFDPHGDVIDDILLRIPEHRKHDVVLVDPSDTEFPIGFNLLQAKTDIEKIVLSSDLVSAFKRHATAWGDTMTSVLSNAVNTFLESDRTGTLIELKRFLIEASFRNKFLESVSDPSLLYYWNNEYPMVRKSISPLLTRIDTFLRPKILRFMMAQNTGVDFNSCVHNNKIILIKLSQGLIGESNAYLLGSLFISKLNQVAQSRQSIHKENRQPFYVYLDEFQNFITPSVTSILSGARKYGLGLILSHQELAQIEDTRILNSIVSNPYTRICFKLGDFDAKRLENGFSYYKASDFQNLNTGQAIIKIGSANNDCNIKTSNINNPNTNAELIKKEIINNTRQQFAKKREVVEQLLLEQLPSNIISKINPTKDKTRLQENSLDTKLSAEEKPTSSFLKQKEHYLKDVAIKNTQRKHTSLQNYIKTIAIQRDFKATLEQKTDNGGRIDIALIKDKLSIAIEISVTNTLDYEIKNIQKCIDDGYHHVCMVSESMLHLKNIKKRARKVINREHSSKIHYLIPLEFANFLDSLTVAKRTKVERVRGYRVTSNFTGEVSSKNSKENIGKIILDSIRKKKR